MNTLNVVESIFFAALEKDSPEARAAYLDEACRGDAQLRSCVEKLLNAHPRAEQFLQAPAPGPAATVEQPAIEERPGSVIGPYKLLQQLGEGGFGVVFLAEQSEPVRRKVALKIIKPGMDSRQVVARFEAERQALALMDHPSIARVFDAGTTESGRPYFVMELVKGVPITEFCDQNRLTPRQRLELFVPVCQAVQHAHQKGVIHRDLKPSNVLVTLYDDRPVPKVIDFGVAKAVEQKLTEQTLFTRVGQVVGTLEYMSPEQASLNALDVDTRSDVYALGVLLYELLTGSTPLGKEQLQGVAFLEMLRLIRETEPPRPSTRLSQLGGGLSLMAAYRKTESQKLPRLMRGELDWIAMKALEKDRTRRYETASALAADVRRYLNEEPVEARAPSAAYRLRKFVKRHRGPVAAAAVVLLALLTGAIGTTWGMVEALTARDEEERQRRAAVGLLDRAVKAEADARTKAQEAKEEAQKAKEATGEALRLAREEKAAQKLARDHLTTAEWRLYASRIASAQREWETDNVGSLYHHLNLSRKDFRGWEHDYLYTLANRYQQFLPATPAKRWANSSLAFSPDGKHLVIADRVVIAPPIRGREPEAVKVKVWDLASGKCIRTLDDTSGPVAFSPDGAHLVTYWNNFTFRPGGGGTALFKVWDAVSGEAVFSLPVEFEYNMGTGTPAFSPDGKRLATCTRGGQLWDMATGKELRTLGHVGKKEAGKKEAPFAGIGIKTASVRAIAFSPDGKQLATVGTQSVKVWEVASGKELMTFEEVGEGVAFSRDGKRLAVSLFDAYNGHVSWVKVLDLTTNKGTVSFKRRGGPLSFTSDGKRVFSTKGAVKVWDVADGKEVITLRGPADPVAVSHDGKRLASLGADGVRIWDLANSTDCLTITVVEQSGHELCMAINPDGKYVAGRSANPDRSAAMIKLWDATPDRSAAIIKLWDATTGQEVRTFKGHTDWVPCVAFSRDGKLLASGSADKTIRLWDPDTGKEVQKLNGPTAVVRNVAFSPDGKYLAGNFGHSAARTTKVWELASRQQVLACDCTRNAFAFSPDSKSVANGFKGVVKVVEVASGREIMTGHGHAGMVNEVAFSPDGKWLASASADKTVKVWELATCKELMTLTGHTGSVTSVAYSPDGKRQAASAGLGAEANMKIWDAASGQELLTLTGHTGYIKRVAFSGDGKRLASVSLDGTIKIWDASKSMKEDSPK